MQRRNVAALIFASLSGILLITTGYNGVSTGFWGWAILIAINISPNPFVTQLLVIAFSILVLFSFLGGWTVIIGCVLLLLKRYRTAFYLIGIGAGLSLMGLIWNVAQLWIFGTLDLATFMSKYQGLAWIGAIFAVIAEELIQMPKNQTKDKEDK